MCKMYKNHQDEKYIIPKRTCKGIMKNGEACKYPPRDINGFCRVHHEQSKIYEMKNPWYIISSECEGQQIYVKKYGIPKQDEKVYCKSK